MVTGRRTPPAGRLGARVCSLLLGCALLLLWAPCSSSQAASQAVVWQRRLLQAQDALNGALNGSTSNTSSPTLPPSPDTGNVTSPSPADTTNVTSPSPPPALDPSPPAPPLDSPPPPSPANTTTSPPPADNTTSPSPSPAASSPPPANTSSPAPSPSDATTSPPPASPDSPTASPTPAPAASPTAPAGSPPPTPATPDSPTGGGTGTPSGQPTAPPKASPSPSPSSGGSSVSVGIIAGVAAGGAVVLLIIGLVTYNVCKRSPKKAEAGLPLKPGSSGGYPGGRFGATPGPPGFSSPSGRGPPHPALVANMVAAAGSAAPGLQPPPGLRPLQLRGAQAPPAVQQNGAGGASAGKLGPSFRAQPQPNVLAHPAAAGMVPHQAGPTPAPAARAAIPPPRVAAVPVPPPAPKLAPSPADVAALAAVAGLQPQPKPPTAGAQLVVAAGARPHGNLSSFAAGGAAAPGHNAGGGAGFGDPHKPIVTPLLGVSGGSLVRPPSAIAAARGWEPNDVLMPAHNSTLASSEGDATQRYDNMLTESTAGLDTTTASASRPPTGVVLSPTPSAAAGVPMQAMGGMGLAPAGRTTSSGMGPSHSRSTSWGTGGLGASPPMGPNMGVAGMGPQALQQQQQYGAAGSTGSTGASAGNTAGASAAPVAAGAAGSSGTLAPMGQAQAATSPATQTRMIDSLRIAWSDLTIGGVLGEGGFGTVYKGWWCGNRVAIKMLSDHVDPSQRRGLYQEALIMADLRHPCVARVYGVVDEAPHHALVMQLYRRGTLARFMSSIQFQDLHLAARLRLGLQIATGMRFMHERKPYPILHGDLKASNVLLEDDPTVTRCVIADFGLASAAAMGGGPDGAPAHTGALTLSISPPEVLRDPRAPRTSKAIDVYSFAIVLWELVTGGQAYRGLRPNDIRMVVLGGRRPAIPPDLPASVAGIIEQCWQGEAASRPSFAEVADRLAAAIQEIDGQWNDNTMMTRTFTATDY